MARLRLDYDEMATGYRRHGLCHALGHTEWLDDERFKTPAGRDRYANERLELTQEALPGTLAGDARPHRWPIDVGRWSPRNRNLAASGLVREPNILPPSPTIG